MSEAKKVFVLDDVIKEKRRTLNLRKEYTHIRGYHGCRPVCIDDYRKLGIKPIERNFALQEAVSRLCDKRITREMVENLFEKEWEKFHPVHRAVWFTFSKFHLLDDCGHYLIYGSEFICGMAAQLYCQSNLRKIGRPTIFACDLPLKNIPSCFLSDIRKKALKGDNGGGFKVTGEVSPKEIVEISSPNLILDPLRYNTPYRYQ